MFLHERLIGKGTEIRADNKRFFIPSSKHLRQQASLCQLFFPSLMLLLEICAAYGVSVIEDTAESLGTVYKGRASGQSLRSGWSLWMS